MVKIYFIVDSIEADGSLGFTNDMVKVRHNISRMPKTFSESFWQKHGENNNGSTVIALTGKYICMIAIAPGGSQGSMTFFDTRLNNDIALDICAKLKSDNVRKEFMKQHQFLQSGQSELNEEAVLTTDLSYFN